MLIAENQKNIVIRLRLQRTILIIAVINTKKGRIPDLYSLSSHFWTFSTVSTLKSSKRFFPDRKREIACWLTPVAFHKA
nr:MAG TPA: hypothetical protein [Caudoviricetes sp.]